MYQGGVNSLRGLEETDYPDPCAPGRLSQAVPFRSASSRCGSLAGPPAARRQAGAPGGLRPWQAWTDDVWGRGGGVERGMGFEPTTTCLEGIIVNAS